MRVVVEGHGMVVFLCVWQVKRGLAIAGLRKIHTIAIISGNNLWNQNSWHVRYEY